MDAIIAKILEIEQRSQEIVGEAEQKRDAFDETLDARKKEMRQNIYNAEAKRFENEKVLILNKAHSEAAEHESRARAKISEMEEFARLHREEWLGELYGRITGSR